MKPKAVGELFTLRVAVAEPFVAWRTSPSELCTSGVLLKRLMPGGWKQSQATHQALSGLEEEEEGELLS